MEIKSRLQQNKIFFGIMLFSVAVYCFYFTRNFSFNYLRQLEVNQTKFERTSLTRPLSVCNHKTADELSLSFCSSLIAGDFTKLESAINFTEKHPRRVKRLDVYINNCHSYVNNSGFITSGVSQEEKDFPIAFSIVVYKDAEQVERLLQAIYRPHNVYCVHVDLSSSAMYFLAITSILKYLPNAFIAPKLVDVAWGQFSLLQAELLCMDSLLKHKVRWKYFINLTGQEFPLRTNYELVKILQTYKGANDINGGYKGANTKRWENLQNLTRGIVPRKGSCHIVASRDFVQYMRTNQTALDVLAWVKGTDVPDETYFSTINYNPQLKAPGAYKGYVDDGKRTWLTRYKLWQSPKVAKECGGFFNRAICIFGLKDLPRLTKVPHLFANKFHFQYQPLAFDCLQQWYFGKVCKEQKGLSTFNTSVYEHRHFIKNSF